MKLFNKEKGRENLAEKCLMLSKFSKTARDLLLEFMEIHVHKFDNPTALYIFELFIT